MTLTRAERDRFAATTPDDIAYSEGACLETPPAVFRRLNKLFNFDVDLTANETNHLLPTWYGPGCPISQAGEDALTVSWGYEGECKSGFSNPPYGPFIPKILKKAIQEREKGFTSVFLLPSRAGAWFQDLVLPYYSELWFCASRLGFFYQGKPRLSSNMKPTKRIKDGHDERFYSPDRVLTLAKQDCLLTYRVDEVDYLYEFKQNAVIQEPAGALFDSIIVVYAPYDRSKWGLFPPPQRPNVWDPRTGELRY